MAAESPPYVIQASSHSAALFRQAVSSLLGATQPGTLTLAAASAGSSPAGVGATAVGGVVNLNDLAVTQNGTPNMSVNVAGGSVWIPQTQAANGGLYFGLNDATVNLAIAAANATNPRIDTVVATVNDAAYSGGSNNWTLSVLTGTPTSGATLSNLSGKATQSASSVVIAYVLVPANATTIITADLLDARPFVTMGFPQRGNPAGLVYTPSGTCISGSALVTYTNSLFLRGGMTFSTAGSNTGLGIPVTGIYRITMQVKVTNGASAQVLCNVFKNSGATEVLDGLQYPVGANAYYQSTLATGLAPLTAGDVLNGTYSNGGSNVPFVGTSGSSNYLCAELVSI